MYMYKYIYVYIYTYAHVNSNIHCVPSLLIQHMTFLFFRCGGRSGTLAASICRGKKTCQVLDGNIFLDFAD